MGYIVDIVINNDIVDSIVHFLNVVHSFGFHIIHSFGSWTQCVGDKAKASITKNQSFYLPVVVGQGVYSVNHFLGMGNSLNKVRKISYL